MSALYELAASHRALADKLNDLDLDEQTISDTLESESGDLMEKGTNVAKVFRNMESFAAQIKEAEAQMAARRKSIEKRAESLKAYLKTNMEIAGISKIESPWFVISIKQNPESVVIDAESEIPEDYLREIPATYAPDKAMIKQAMKDGFNVPGVHLARSTRIEIK
jgi:hypothetical protein